MRVRVNIFQLTYAVSDYHKKICLEVTNSMILFQRRPFLKEVHLYFKTELSVFSLSCQVGSIWLPVDPVSKYTCLRFVKGSHRWPHYLKPVHFGGTTKFYEIKPGEEEEAKLFVPAPDTFDNEDHEVLSWDMQVSMKPRLYLPFYTLRVTSWSMC